MAAGIAAAWFAPDVPTLTSVAAATLAPVSHPASLAGRSVDGWFSRKEPAVDASQAQALIEENRLLRQRVEQLLVQAQRFSRLDEYRQALGTKLRDATVPAAVIGFVGENDDLLSVVKADVPAGSPVLGIDGGLVAIIGTLEPQVGRLGRVRLTGGTTHRPIGGRFAGGDDAEIELISEPFVLNGDDGHLVIRRHRTTDLEASGVEVGDWAILADDDWPMLLDGYRLGRVLAIEPVPDASGFSRVVLEPAVDAKRLDEVQVVVTGGGS
jgi:hypothetical protein